MKNHDKKIYIDFQGGAHGNFLEFVCNRFLAGIKSVKSSPFNKNGASHDKNYLEEPIFSSWHYFDYSGECTIPSAGKIISIQINADDLLPLSMISLMRAGDYSFDNNQLEVNTYNKLNNPHYRWVLDNIIHSFFNNQVANSYNSVKDVTWPNITSIEEYHQLPDWIKDECRDMHNLELLDISEFSPDVPRHILREFFKIGFKDPEISGFMTQQKKMCYNSDNDVLIFPFSSFYNSEKFLSQIKKIGQWASFSLTNNQELVKLHKQFLLNQPYKDSKSKCDEILKKIYNKEFFKFTNIELLEESYILAELEKHFDCELSIKEWFVSSDEFYRNLKK